MDEFKEKFNQIKEKYGSPFKETGFIKDFPFADVFLNFEENNSLLEYLI